MFKKNSESSVSSKYKKSGKKVSFFVSEISFRFKIFIFLFVLLIAIVVITTSFYSFVSAILIFCSFGLVAFYGFLIFLKYGKLKLKMVNNLLFSLETKSKQSFLNFPIPVVVCSSNGLILWHNEAFKVNLNFEGNDVYINLNLCQIFNKSLEDFCVDVGTVVNYKNKHYKVFAKKSKRVDVFILIFEDISEHVILKNKFELSKVCVLYVAIDNYREILMNRKDSEKSAIVGLVDNLLENFVDENDGILQKYREDEFLIVITQNSLNNIIKNKFQILQTVKNTLQNDKQCYLTLSIGVGSGSSSFSKCKEMAFQALDMALGRGGDQAAIKTLNSFSFFGGNSKELYKSSRVKARVVARALLELVNSSSNVIIMGHKFADLDSFGSAVGLALAVRKMKKNSYVLINSNNNLPSLMFEKIDELGYNDLVIDFNVANSLADLNTLLVIVDTHNLNLLDSADIFKVCKNVVVIDHHRKVVDCVKGAVIFYHEPYASSTCELVCELIQQFGYEKLIGQFEAQALLAGIILDTKSFAIKVGVRTFEAAAYLKRCGADTTEVKKLFASSFEAYSQKIQIVLEAKIYRKCAVAVSRFKSENLRIVASQAADELLYIEGVDASFVLYEIEKSNSVFITARSFGEFNVQVIMERFGGGGHQLQAACQIENFDLDKTYDMLIKAIDEFLN